MLSLKGRGYFISIHSLYSVVHGKSGREKIEAKTKKMLVAIMIVLCFYKITVGIIISQNNSKDQQRLNRAGRCRRV